MARSERPKKTLRGQLCHPTKYPDGTNDVHCTTTLSPRTDVIIYSHVAAIIRYHQSAGVRSLRSPDQLCCPLYGSLGTEGERPTVLMFASQALQTSVGESRTLQKPGLSRTVWWFLLDSMLRHRTWQVPKIRTVPWGICCSGLSEIAPLYIRTFSVVVDISGREGCLAAMCRELGSKNRTVVNPVNSFSPIHLPFSAAGDVSSDHLFLCFAVTPTP